MTNIPKELKQKIERDAKEYSCDLDKPYSDFAEIDFQQGAQSIAEQLVKAVEALKCYEGLGWSTEYAYSDGTYCFNVVAQEKVITAANEFLKEHEAWLKGE